MDSHGKQKKQGMFQTHGRALCAASLSMNDSRSGERVIQRAEQRWVVREINTTNQTGGHGRRCLICESEEIVRRVWEYPDDWDRLSDEALLELCARSVRH